MSKARTGAGVRQAATKAPKFGRRTVTIKVGENEDVFDVHEHLLKRHTEFFASALNEKKDWRERKERCVKLPEDDPEIFELFIQFVYFGQVFSVKEGDVQEGSDGASSDKEFGRLCDLWLLGEELMSVSFKDAVVDALSVKVSASSACPLSMHDTIFNGSSKKAGMRRLLIDMAVWGWTDEDVAEDAGTNKDFLLDLAVALSKTRRNGRQGVAPYKANSCTYHEHVAEDKPCYKTMF